MDALLANYFGVFVGWVVVSLLGALVVWGIDASHSGAPRPSHA